MSTTPLNTLARFDVQGNFYPATGEDAQREDLVLIPSECLGFSQLHLPGKGRLWQDALPYALEEELAQPLDEVKIFVMHRQGDGTTQVSWMDQRLWQKFLDKLQQLNLGQAALVPDVFCLALAENSPALVQHAERILLRQSPWTGQVFPQAWQGLLTPAQLALSRTTPQWTSVQQLKAFNLRQWSKESSRGEKAWSGLVNGLLVLALMVTSLYAWQLLLNTRQWQQETAQIQQQTQRVFFQIFPDKKRLVNLRSQTQQQLKTWQASAGQRVSVMQLWTPLIPILNQAQGVSVLKLDFQSPQLTIEVSAQNAQYMEALAKTLKSLHTTHKVNLKLTGVTATETRGVIDVQP